MVKDFGLPAPDTARPTNLRISREIQEEVYDNIEELQHHAEQSVATMNDEQKTFFCLIHNQQGPVTLWLVDHPLPSLTADLG